MVKLWYIRYIIAKIYLTFPVMLLPLEFSTKKRKRAYALFFLLKLESAPAPAINRADFSAPGGRITHPAAALCAQRAHNQENDERNGDKQPKPNILADLPHTRIFQIHLIDFIGIGVLDELLIFLIAHHILCRSQIA